MLTRSFRFPTTRLATNDLFTISTELVPIGRSDVKIALYFGREWVADLGNAINWSTGMPNALQEGWFCILTGSTTAIWVPELLQESHALRLLSIAEKCYFLGNHNP
jgi:hypothetical protein